jgi:ubiquinone/menaquinone biosynthesis C-methylase UbiE
VTAGTQERWQHGGSEPEFFERYAVPSLFGPMALRLLENVSLRPGQRVLDVACGTGIVARLAAPRVAPSGRVVGIDLNEAMLAVARAHAQDAAIAIDWKQGDATSLPFADAAFDAVLCQQGLQFFPDKVGALRELRRVAAPGGLVALAVWGRVSRFNTALAEALADRVGENVATRSLAPFALADASILRTLMSDAGFGTIEIRTTTLIRRVQPTQKWLLQYSGGHPVFGRHCQPGPDGPRRDGPGNAAKLNDLWDAESFAVPSEVHLAYAQKPR